MREKLKKKLNAARAPAPAPASVSGDGFFQGQIDLLQKQLEAATKSGDLRKL